MRDLFFLYTYRMYIRKHLESATNLANLLDNKFEIFGLRFGIDPLLGLIPGGGDFLSLLLSLYIVWIGLQMELPRNKIERMLWNIILDFVIGLAPVIGDAADFVFKSNLMNLQILNQHVDKVVIEGEIVGNN
jgi:hypothetical protein